MTLSKKLILSFVAVLTVALPLRADKLTVAAASNLVYALDTLNAVFHQVAPDIEVTTLTGASGSLFAQITHGAPIDVFLSADTDYPQKLVKAGAADAATLTTFATGRLALWTTKPGLDVSDVATTLADPRVQHIAIANPKTAPYGRAARQTLDALKLSDAVASRLVLGENIAQTAQFVETGNAEVGFVALTFVLAPLNKNKGTYSEVPQNLYTPLDQGAVITKHGSANPAAKRYLEFLNSSAAREVLQRFGYGLPDTK